MNYSMEEPMRIFVAGATGVIGVPLVKLLVDRGHDVAGMTRTPAKAETLRALGVHPIVCDVYDGAALEAAVMAFRPELVMHQLTDLPDELDELPAYLDRNSRIRRVGTKNLLEASKAANARCFMAQSVAWELPGDGGLAVREHESAVLSAGGVVLRYGRFYGPGTFGGDEAPPHPRIHVDEAARRTVAAMALRAATVTIVEPDEPR
jgi:nucleoside-diphosphate-sugar epimerase